MFSLIFPLVFILISCKGQSETPVSEKQVSNTIITEFSGSLRSSFLDKEGILWFGTNNGLYRHDGSTFTSYKATDGFTDKSVMGIIEDKSGNLWLGTDAGLYRYDRKVFTYVPIPFQDTSSLWLDQVYPIINPNAVHSLCYDRQGNIWIGTGGGGVYRYDGDKFTSFLSKIGRKQIDSLHHNWVPSITEDSEGNIWFASMTHGGVSRYDGDVFTHFMPKDGLTDDMLRIIYLDKKDKLWFGYNGNRNSGLSSYNGQVFDNYYLDDGLCHPRVRAIYEDKSGSIWLGGDLANLCIFDGENFSDFTKNGQVFENVLVIVEDALGNVWFGGKGNLWRYDGESVLKM